MPDDRQRVVNGVCFEVIDPKGRLLEKGAWTWQEAWGVVQLLGSLDDQLSDDSRGFRDKLKDALSRSPQLQEEERVTLSLTRRDWETLCKVARESSYLEAGTPLLDQLHAAHSQPVRSLEQVAERCVHTGGEWGCPNCLTERYEMAEAERDNWKTCYDEQVAVMGRLSKRLGAERDRYRQALERELESNHHWCHRSQQGKTGCACGKTQRDIRIRQALTTPQEGNKETLGGAPVENPPEPDVEPPGLKSYEEVTIGNACGVEMAGGGTFCWKPKNHTGPHGRSRTK